MSGWFATVTAAIAAAPTPLPAVGPSPSPSRPPSPLPQAQRPGQPAPAVVPPVRAVPVYTTGTGLGGIYSGYPEPEPEVLEEVASKLAAAWYLPRRLRRSRRSPKAVRRYSPRSGPAALRDRCVGHRGPVHRDPVRAAQSVLEGL